MGFSQSDWQAQQGKNINLDRVRWGHRMEPRQQLNVPYQGQRGLVEQKRRKPPTVPPKPEDPGLARFQLRLW
jgi:hypothetical protein